MTAPNVGIWALGTFLPETVRPNAWWPQATIDQWKARLARRFTNLSDMGDLSPGAKLVLEATAKYADDPFEGARERRVIDDDMTSSDMAIAAARDAMERAAVGPGDIDFLLVQSMVPDFLNTPDGCRVHAELGLPARCFTANIDMACSGFLSQLAIGQAFIHSGLGRVGLLVQCAAMSRIMHAEDPWSAAFGDAATAEVIGPVSPGYGVLAQAHATDGRFHGGLVTGVPGKHWTEGVPHVCIEDHDKARAMVMSIPDIVKGLIEDTLAQAKVAKDEVAFLAAHQATIWFGEVVQAHTGLHNARRVNTFPWTTSLSGSNLPMVMSIAEKEGLLAGGDLAVMFAGANGMTAAAFVHRWGGR